MSRKKTPAAAEQPAAPEETFVCLACGQRQPVSQRAADDEPFDKACFEKNQARLAAEEEAAAKEAADAEAVLAEQDEAQD